MKRLVDRTWLFYDTVLTLKRVATEVVGMKIVGGLCCVVYVKQSCMQVLLPWHSHINKKNQNAKLTVANRHVDESMKRVFSGDESKFNLVGSGSRQYHHDGCSSTPNNFQCRPVREEFIVGKSLHSGNTTFIGLVSFYMVARRIVTTEDFHAVVDDQYFYVSRAGSDALRITYWYHL